MNRPPQRDRDTQTSSNGFNASAPNGDVSD